MSNYHILTQDISEKIINATNNAGISYRTALLLLLITLAFVGAASATDYYVATWGDNSSSGNITHPWQNVSYATQQAVAGDTIHLFDGTWYNETCTFANSGNATHQITLTSYNGTPTLDGVDRTGNCISADGKSYINITGPLLIKNHAAATSFHYCEHINISNIEADGGWYGIEGDGVSLIQNGYSNYTTISDCVFHDSGWNTVTFYGNREPPNGNGIPSTYFTIRNCTIYNSTKHNSIDLFGNVQHVIIEDCLINNSTSGGIFRHDNPDHQEYITIRNSVFRDLSTYAISLYDSTEGIWVSDVEIYGNTFDNITLQHPIELSNLQNVTIYNNSFYTTVLSAGRLYNNALNVTYHDNYVAEDCGDYYATSGSKVTVRNPIGKKTIHLYSDNSSADLEWDDGTVFTAATDKAYKSWTPVRYYTDRSNCSLTAIQDATYITPVVAYNITLRPIYAYLYNVTVNHESNSSDDRTNITVNSNVTTNPTWINATMQNASNTYNVSIDGVYTTQVTSDSGDVVQYHYTSSWSPHDFEFNWVDQGDFSPDHTKAYYNPNSPIENIVNSTGYHFYNRTLGWDDTETISFKLVVTTS